MLNQGAPAESLTDRGNRYETIHLPCGNRHLRALPTRAPLALAVAAVAVAGGAPIVARLRVRTVRKPYRAWQRLIQPSSL